MRLCAAFAAAVLLASLLHAGEALSPAHEATDRGVHGALARSLSLPAAPVGSRPDLAATNLMRREASSAAPVSPASAAEEGGEEAGEAEAEKEADKEEEPSEPDGAAADPPKGPPPGFDVATPAPSTVGASAASADDGAGSAYYDFRKYQQMYSTEVQKLLEPMIGIPEHQGMTMLGLVKVVAPVTDETSRDILEERGKACMQEMTINDCMSRVGSYGIRRLWTFPYDQVQALGYERPNWMANDVVQQKQFLSVPLPMSHASSAFEVFNEFFHNLGKGASAPVLRQTYDIYQQLRLGVRALDVGVAVNTLNKHLYGANGLLTVSLARVLADVDRFLSENPKEVVMLDFKKATWLHPESESYGSLELLEAEESDDKKIPGQMVHQLVFDYLEAHIADYAKLSEISADYVFGSPLVKQLVEADARVMYFWEGQQVLCRSLTSCKRTPGWQAHEVGQPFAFGPPMLIGSRQAASGATSRVAMEPLCMNPSERLTMTDDPVLLVTLLRQFSTATRNVTTAHGGPKCYPADTEVPKEQDPPLVNRVDAYLSTTPYHIEQMETLFRSESEIFAHGEALTHRSAAEHVNYLMLVWYFDKGQKQVYAKPNVIATDHVHPAIVHRIVDGAQEAAECGYTMHCRDTGSCFAQNLHAGRLLHLQKYCHRTVHA
eukprot:TRINITY_DN27433_c0_g1_i2.p1 TRINITY_DN27433_c0_g1~~TRINITY_DN27433_c0_g1_i2.p1  ORF type:complete len:662 (-),score=151.88 TRINITY_DN27433_c0_g1_i2:456-2441(-)